MELYRSSILLNDATEACWASVVHLNGPHIEFTNACSTGLGEGIDAWWAANSSAEVDAIKMAYRSYSAMLINEHLPSGATAVVTINEHRESVRTVVSSTVGQEFLHATRTLAGILLNDLSSASASAVATLGHMGEPRAASSLLSVGIDSLVRTAKAALSLNDQKGADFLASLLFHVFTDPRFDGFDLSQGTRIEVSGTTAQYGTNELYALAALVAQHYTVQHAAVGSAASTHGTTSHLTTGTTATPGATSHRTEGSTSMQGATLYIVSGSASTHGSYDLVLPVTVGSGPRAWPVWSTSQLLLGYPSWGTGAWLSVGSPSVAELSVLSLESATWLSGVMHEFTSYGYASVGEQAGTPFWRRAVVAPGRDSSSRGYLHGLQVGHGTSVASGAHLEIGRDPGSAFARRVASTLGQDPGRPSAGRAQMNVGPPMSFVKALGNQVGYASADAAAMLQLGETEQLRQLVSLSLGGADLVTAMAMLHVGDLEPVRALLRNACFGVGNASPRITNAMASTGRQHRVDTRLASQPVGDPGLLRSARAVGLIGEGFGMQRLSLLSLNDHKVVQAAADLLIGRDNRIVGAKASHILQQLMVFCGASAPAALGVNKELGAAVMERLGREQDAIRGILQQLAVELIQRKGLVERLGVPGQTKLFATITRLSDATSYSRGAVMPTLIREISKLAAAISLTQVERHDLFTLVSRLVGVEPAPHPTVAVPEFPPVAWIQRTNVSTFLVGGQNGTSYKYRLGNGAWSEEILVAEPIQLVLTVGSYALSVNLKNASGVWQTVPTVAEFTVERMYEEPPIESWGLRADAGSLGKQIRTIGLSVNPHEATSYSLDLQLASGTFSYAGMLSAPPAVKAVVSVQGINGIVERSGPNASRSEPGYSIEGRLLPEFTSEFINVRFPTKTSDSPGDTELPMDMSTYDKRFYTVETILDEVKLQSGTEVTFTATNNNVLNFEFTGRFTDALSQIADLACGDLVQQNGMWYIVPKGTTIGEFTVPVDDLIDIKQSNQGDILDTVYSMIEDYKDTYVALKFKNQDVDDALRPNRRTIPLGDIKFEFGGKDAQWKNIANSVNIIGGEWDSWTPVGNSQANPAKPSHWYITREYMNDTRVTEYLKVEPDPTDKNKMRGLKDPFGCTIIVNFSKPADASGLYYAKGKLINLSSPQWAGDEDTWWLLTPKRIQRHVVHADSTVEWIDEWFWQFEFAIHADPNWAKPLYWQCDLTVEYIPSSYWSTVSTDLIAARNDLQAKLNCLESELTRYGFASIIKKLQEAGDAWYEYEKGRNDGKTDTELTPLYDAAVVKDREIVNLVVAAVSSGAAQVKLTTISMLYNNILPLPANKCLLGSTVPNSPVVVDCGRIESVSMQGYTVTINARKL